MRINFICVQYIGLRRAHVHLNIFVLGAAKY